MADEGKRRGAGLDQGTLVGLCVFGGLFLLVIVLLATRELPQELSVELKGQFLIEGWDRAFNDDVLGLFATATTFGIPAYLWLRHRHAWARRVAPYVLALLVLGSGLTYLYGTRGIPARHFPRMWDSYHYVLGPKYFEELGYWDLYDCTLVADAEGAHVIRNRDQVRDLYDYSMRTAGELRARTHCRDAFEDERWEQFKADVDLFTSHTSPRFMRDVLQDHGYNGTPFQTFVAGGIANTFTLDFESLVWASLIDIGALCLMGFFAARAFGWRVGLLFAIFFFTNFADRFFYNGASFARYLWIACLVIGVCMLERRRPATGAVLVTASAMLSAFPALFLVGIAYKGARSLLATRRLTGEHKRFLLGAAIATLVFGGLSMSHGRHVANYVDFLDNMSIHASYLSRNRIGFAYDFLFRGEVTATDAAYSWGHKGAELARIRPLVWGLIGLILAALAALVPRLDDLEATVLTGFALLFLLFGTVEYYYAVAALLVLLWRRRLATRGGRAMLWLTFATMPPIYLVFHFTQFLPFCNNTLLSWAFTALLLGAIGVLARATGLWGELRGRWAAIRGAGH